MITWSWAFQPQWASQGRQDTGCDPLGLGRAGWEGIEGAGSDQAVVSRTSCSNSSAFLLFGVIGGHCQQPQVGPHASRPGGEWLLEQRRSKALAASGTRLSDAATTSTYRAVTWGSL